MSDLDDLVYRAMHRRFDMLNEDKHEESLKAIYDWRVTHTESEWKKEMDRIYKYYSFWSGRYSSAREKTDEELFKMNYIAHLSEQDLDFFKYPKEPINKKYKNKKTCTCGYEFPDECKEDAEYKCKECSQLSCHPCIRSNNLHCSRCHVCYCFDHLENNLFKCTKYDERLCASCASCTSSV